LVTPPVQKNGHKFAFGVPWSLALRINAYIYDGISDDSRGAVACGLSKEGVTRPIGGRARLILASGKSPRNGQNRIFLSSRDATPLSAHTIVNRFAKAIKAVGAPKGSGYHSLRRGMMDEFADETMDKRRRKGLSTAREDVLQDFEDKLGHTTGNSLHAYIRASRRTTKQTTEERQHDDLVASSIEIEQLMARLAYQDQHIRESAKAKSRSRKARIGDKRAILS
ncbi:hypothetical protein PQQ51_31045, partial [Paraburkholderia xenovorans]|uniref:hypothetical protein n=1 Tax=Paraburkholderia xenovorans TaxID=36873 RepID=UPI0038BE1739